MSENLNAPINSKTWYEMENERLKQQLATEKKAKYNLMKQLGTAVAQRDRAWAALRYAADPNHRDDLFRKEHAQAIAEARENGDAT